MEICIFRLRVWDTVHVCCFLMIGEVPLHGKEFLFYELFEEKSYIKYVGGRKLPILPLYIGITRDIGFFFLMEQSVAKPTIAVTHLPVTH